MKKIGIILITVNTIMSCNMNRLEEHQLNFVQIMPGKFLAGSNFADNTTFHPEWYLDEKPVHEVVIKRNFCISSTEVTIADFRKFIEATGYISSAEQRGESFGAYHEDSDGKASWAMGKGLNWKNPGYPVKDSFPVTHVSWMDAMAFCKWLTETDKHGWIYTLPSENQWEYAASCGGKYIYAWGNDAPSDKKGGNIADESFLQKYPNWKYPFTQNYNDGFALVAPVASYAANEWGLYDMTGNVWEWTSDPYKAYPGADSSTLEAVQANIERITENGQSGNAADLRIHKGAGFDWEMPFLRVAKRRAQLKDYSAIHIGFRVIRYREQ